MDHFGQNTPTNAYDELKKYARSPMVRALKNLPHDYVFATKYVKSKGLPPQLRAVAFQ
jgi:hypothetical protein